MTTTADLVYATRDLLMASGRSEINLLSEALDATETDVDFSLAAGGIARGAILSVDLEQMMVTSVTGSTATVIRGWQSTAATHANGTVIFVNDRQPASLILRHLNAELASYSSPSVGLFKVLTTDLTASPTRSGYALPAGVIDILAVEALDVLPGDRLRLERWRVIRDQSTTDFASGTALYLHPGEVLPGKAIRVVYKTAFTALATMADDVEAVSGLPASAHDIPPLGVAARVLASREARRGSLDAQPEPRAAQDVPPGTNSNGSRGLLVLRNMRLNEEASRLAQRYPMVSRKAAV